jgi:hypothetical protein
MRAFCTTCLPCTCLWRYPCHFYGHVYEGHNRVCPCKMCNIRGIKAPGGKVNYVPLDRLQYPEAYVPKYNPSELPHQTHAEMKEQAEKVQFAPNTAQSEKLATEYGIKGTSALMALSSLSFPGSFPYHFMHLIFKNIVYVGGQVTSRISMRAAVYSNWTRKYGRPLVQLLPLLAFLSQALLVHAHQM